MRLLNTSNRCVQEVSQQIRITLDLHVKDATTKKEFVMTNTLEKAVGLTK
jgi:hypothetical protein